MDFLKTLKRNWNILSSVALFIIGILGTFLKSPPDYIASENIFTNAGKFIATLVVGLMFVPVILWKSKGHTRNWWILASVTFILSIVCLFTYLHLKQKWMCPCFDENKLILIGSELRPDLDESVKDSNCQELLQGSSCHPERVWKKDSIDKNRLFLAGVYVLSLPLFIISMISVVQAIYCSNRRQQN